MNFSRTYIETFAKKYKRLKFVPSVNPTTGGVDWEVFNYRNQRVLKYTGSKSSILLTNKLYTINSCDKIWLEEKLNAMLESFGGEIVR